MATWSTVRTRIRAELEDANGDLWATTTLREFLNEGARDLAMRVRPTKNEYYSTAASGQRSYELPDNTIEVETVWFGDDALNTNDYRNYLADDTTGTPSEWAVLGSAIYLYPIPNLAGTLRVIRWDYPVAATETSAMPFESRYDYALKHYIKARCYETVEDFNAADRFTQLYEKDVADIEWQIIRKYEQGGTRLPTEVW